MRRSTQSPTTFGHRFSTFRERERMRESRERETPRSRSPKERESQGGRQDDRDNLSASMSGVDVAAWVTALRSPPSRTTESMHPGDIILDLDEDKEHDKRFSRSSAAGGSPRNSVRSSSFVFGGPGSPLHRQMMERRKTQQTQLLEAQNTASASGDHVVPTVKPLSVATGTSPPPTTVTTATGTEPRDRRTSTASKMTGGSGSGGCSTCQRRSKDFSASNKESDLVGDRQQSQGTTTGDDAQAAREEGDSANEDEDREDFEARYGAYLDEEGANNTDTKEPKKRTKKRRASMYIKKNTGGAAVAIASKLRDSHKGKTGGGGGDSEDAGTPRSVTTPRLHRANSSRSKLHRTDSGSRSPTKRKDKEAEKEKDSKTKEKTGKETSDSHRPGTGKRPESSGKRDKDRRDKDKSDTDHKDKKGSSHHDSKKSKDTKDHKESEHKKDKKSSKEKSEKGGGRRPTPSPPTKRASSSRRPTHRATHTFASKFSHHGHQHLVKRPDSDQQCQTDITLPPFVEVSLSVEAGNTDEPSAVAALRQKYLSAVLEAHNNNPGSSVVPVTVPSAVQQETPLMYEFHQHDAELGAGYGVTPRSESESVAAKPTPSVRAVSIQSKTRAASTTPREEILDSSDYNSVSSFFQPHSMHVTSKFSEAPMWSATSNAAGHAPISAQAGGGSAPSTTGRETTSGWSSNASTTTAEAPRVVSRLKEATTAGTQLHRFPNTLDGYADDETGGWFALGKEVELHNRTASRASRYSGGSTSGEETKPPNG
eukprot:TRINITY_DN28410_c0_g1_i1.p1 TRINITY_DN28410_c0_g1~~TRINITY_DN28410_c0_g1_i1.p1  ORF type:complete len:875 (-),score=102.96 TRINITY_DN28410_c0_g1_i1:22-2319(-)